VRTAFSKLFMRRVSIAAAVVISALGASPSYHLSAAPQRPASAPAAAVQPRQVLDKYCVSCHNTRLHSGGLALDSVDPAQVTVKTDVWEKVIRKLRTGSMPPVGLPRPDAATLTAVASSLESAIDADAMARPQPGRTEALHRLNRTEYQNAVRDLLALDIDAAALVPADDQSYGFDNLAGVLKMSPTLLERYIGAARDVSRLAVGVAKIPPTAETFRLRSDLSQYQHLEGLPLGTRGGTAVRYTFPQDGEYLIKVEMLDLFSGAQIKEPHNLEISVDGRQAQLFKLGESKKMGQDPNDPTADLYTSQDALQVRVPVRAGPHVVTTTFVKKTEALAETVRKPFVRPHGEGDFLLYQPHIGTVTISGPFNGSPAQDTPSRRRIFVCRPATAADETVCAKQIVSTLARRAYRRPVSDADIQPLLSFYADARASGGFDAGVERALQALLVSSSFLYRVERDPSSARGPYRLTDLELASRLSFFLWSSIPDDQLLDVASKGQLKTPAVLDREVRRMLKDPRSEALATNFAAQWLRLRNVSGALPDDVIFPNFSDNLRQDFVTETQRFFQSIVQENRGVLELLTADYTFVNERLAKHYGIPNVYGSEFRRVTLPEENRRGLLGQASVLTATSYSDRTSIVGRGKWILENVLGTPPPPPPPNVPALKENTSNGKLLSMRERMTAHRANPVCASCHNNMDPLGFALDNFDAVGRWRARAEGGQAIDASGGLADGTTFNGPAELRQVLTRRPEQFVTVVAEKLLVYALGRGNEFYDASPIRRAVRASAASNYSFASLIVGLVTSTPFQMRSLPEAAPEQTVAARP
jgi:mono/diheme cytochrome c family protein